MTSSRSDVLKAALQQRILIIDGAMGTMIQRHKLQEEDYRGTRFADWPHDVKGNNDLLVLTKPDIIAGIHDAYCAAGADILETNSFNSTVVSQADYHMEELVYELNVEAARVARAVADKWTAQTPEKPRFVAGVLGPTSRTCSISPDVNAPSYRNVTFDELVQSRYFCRTGFFSAFRQDFTCDDFRHHYRCLWSYFIGSNCRSILELGASWQFVKYWF